MKHDNIKPTLLKYNLTFTKLHIPFLALTQLYIAYYRAYIAGMVNNNMGMPRSFVLLIKQFLVSSLFLVLSLLGGKSFKLNPKSIPFVIMTGMIHVSLSQQLFTRSQIANGPFITACYQPIVPAVSTLGAILLKFEVGTTLKYVGIVVCFVATGTRLFYDDLYDTYEGSQFIGKFFLFNQVLFLSIGVLLQKMVIAKNPNCSLLVMVFYIYGCGFLTTIIIYHVKYWNDTYNEDSAHNTLESYNSYLSLEYFYTLANVAAIYGSLIL